jgi:hypothetical protein
MLELDRVYSEEELVEMGKKGIIFQLGRNRFSDYVSGRKIYTMKRVGNGKFEVSSVTDPYLKKTQD